MIKVKLTLCDNSKISVNSFLKQTPDFSGRWGDFQFYFDNNIDKCDYWVVYENLPQEESVICPKENTIFIAGEPTAIKKYNEKFLNQFSKIITCQRRIQGPNVFYMASGHTWFPQKSYDELQNNDNVEKNKLISIVVSNKSNTPGHQKRLEFCLNLKKHFGDKIDIFGRGINDFEDKWDVLAPYKYSIAIENSVEEDNVTEKIGDCFTTLTFPFYYGCPNIDTYYNKDSYQLIDINDFEGSCKTIERIINDEQHYEQHLESLIRSKNTYINKLTLIPLITNFIENEYRRLNNSSSKTITLTPTIKFQKKSFAHIIYIIKKMMREKYDFVKNNGK